MQVTSNSFVIGVIGSDENTILRSTLHLFVYEGMLQWAAEELFNVQIAFSSLESVQLPSGRLHRVSSLQIVHEQTQLCMLEVQSG